MVVTRSAATSVSELLPAFRLVLLGGARQTGKTTLVRETFVDHLLSPATEWDVEPAPLAAGQRPHPPSGVRRARPR